jgi:murein DD-endopeptidase MepM/ murein hydrolase activator NlpD
MRRSLTVIALLAFATPASAGTGGSDVPPYNGPVTDDGGGAVYKKPTPKARKKKPKKAAKRKARPSGGPVLSSFAVRSKRIYAMGAPATVAFRIDSRRALRDVRLYLVPTGSRTPASTIKLGPLARGTDHRIRVTGTENGVLAEGTYTVRLAAKDSRGRRLRRAAGISSTASLTYLLHRFPVAGPFSWGGADARFGAGRTGHRHQGQDLSAAEGTPVVAPRGGTIKAVQYQANGGGHYVVLSASGEDRDYVFMHLVSGSIPVVKGQTVRTGQRIGQVGNTGASFGAHLHFEIWTGGGWYTGGKPVDPLPYLKAWSR